ncbi:hypothetical protein R6Z07F_018381 [Ovis aries]
MRTYPLGRLQKYPKIHVSPGEESSGSGPDSTQGLRPRHRMERNAERPPRNSHGDWPFLRPPERVPEVPVLMMRDPFAGGRERILGVLVTSQEEALSTGRREVRQRRSTIPRVPQLSQSIPEEPVFPALTRLSRRGSTATKVARGTALCESLVGQPCGKASWESLVENPGGKATDPMTHEMGNVTLLLQIRRKAHLHAPSRDED